MVAELILLDPAGKEKRHRIKETKPGTVDFIQGRVIDARVAFSDTGPKSMRLVLDLQIPADFEEAEWTSEEVERVAKEEFISVVYKAIKHFGDWLLMTGRTT